MTQEILPEPFSERDDLISYISDTYKELNGIRPRWMPFDEMSMEELRAEAEKLDDEVRESYDLVCHEDDAPWEAYYSAEDAEELAREAAMRELSYEERWLNKAVELGYAY